MQFPPLQLALGHRVLLLPTECGCARGSLFRLSSVWYAVGRRIGVCWRVGLVNGMRLQQRLRLLVNQK